MRFSAYRTPRARLLALALGSLTPAAAMLLPTAAHAQQEAERNYDIPAGPLSGVLARFGAESGLLLSSDAALLEGRHSAGLKGRYGGVAALRHLLAGSGLEFRTGGGVIVIEPAAASDASGTTMLNAVRVTARPESLGTNVIDRERLDAIGAGNGDITSALRMLPNIQYANDQLHTGRQGEIEPAEISIHGAKFYDNQYLFDGMSFSNDIDPDQTNPNEASRPSSSSQGLAIDTSLLCNITVRDSNIPAEYGRFSGGVVAADTCAPTRDFGGRVSMEITRSEWMEYKLTDSQKADYAVSTSDSQQPDFDKKTYRLALQGRPTENLGLIGSYVLKTSEIPLKAYGGGAISASDDSGKTEKRRSENLYLRGFWNLGSGVDADFALSYAPATSRNFIVNTKDSWFDIKSGGQGVNLGLRHRHDAATVSHRLTWSEYESSRDSDASVFRTWRHSAAKDWGYRSSATAWNSQEGQYGDIEQKQSTWYYQVKADWLPFKLGNTEHGFQTGLELSRQEKYFHRLQNGAMIFTPTSATTCATAGGGVDSENCSMGATSVGNWPGQYLKSATFYHAGKFNLDNNYRAVFGQYEMQWERVRLRLGLRYEDDDLAPEPTVAPRSALLWDVFGDTATRVELGANRYYSRNFMAFYTRQKILALQTSATRNLTRGVLTDWVETASTSWRNYRSSELDVPYSDERMAGISQRWLGAIWSLKWVERESRDEILRRTAAEGGWSYRNGGQTSARSTTLGIESERPFRFGPTSTTFVFSVEQDDIKTSHASYDDGISDVLWGSIVRYDGKFINYNDRPANNFNRPVTARLLLATSIPSSRLTVGNLFRYRDSYRKIVANGTADYDGMAVTNYEPRTFRPAVTWDMRINYDLPTVGDQSAFVVLSIDNVLNRSNEIEDSANELVYEKGRQFWVEFGYRF
ncbi:TonB-dependent receptor [Thauera sinica]|uniref:TonB-dependent receptor plug domain-containing protein n=1 Tax=Thauera sinica TaxID=2665146 RepID=A0ABW1AMQ3_9RHOO|nr:TonB-dependent receptor plug domain-containing protein [Thauera sp. K11]ATE60683.1 hypothetical protein CCZ27_12675 [Thauera sp. K11]